MSTLPNLDAIQARTDAATYGPWEAGEHYHVQAEDRCQCLPDYGPLVGINPDGEYGRMHVHRRAEALWDTGVNARDDSVGGRAVIVETSEYGLMTPEDQASIAAARSDVPVLVAALRDVLDLHYAEPYAQGPDYCAECDHQSPCPTVRALAARLDIPKEKP